MKAPPRVGPWMMDLLDVSTASREIRAKNLKNAKIRWGPTLGGGPTLGQDSIICPFKLNPF